MLPTRLASRSLVRAIAAFTACACLVFAATGCHRGGQSPSAPPAQPAPPPEISEIDLKTYKPNEAGAVMILMYHNILASKPNSDMNRTPDQFRKDLQDLYDRGYRPVTVTDFVTDHMDVPAGKTPVVITFDDGYKSQFNYLAGEEIDPDCAVGIMEAFHNAHPDWATKATFFVIHRPKPPVPFYQQEAVASKYAFLLKQGYEIGNHSATHPSLRHATAAKVENEIATVVRSVAEVAPEAKLVSFAIPGGIAPKDPEALKACIQGEDGGTSYKHSAVLLAAWRPVLSPITKPSKRPVMEGRVAAFNPFGLERIIGGDGPAELATYLKTFDDNPGLRYISDGNPNVAAVPASMKSLVDAGRVRAEGKVLQIYSFKSNGPHLKS